MHRALKKKLEANYAFLDDYLAHKLGLGPEPPPYSPPPPAPKPTAPPRAPRRVPNAPPGPPRRGRGAAAPPAAAAAAAGLAGPPAGAASPASAGLWLPSAQPLALPRTLLGGAGGLGRVVAAAAVAQALEKPPPTLMDIYNTYWLPFGKLLTDMEQAGVKVNRCGGAPHITQGAAPCSGSRGAQPFLAHSC